jgi:peptide/nickel transport system permease protein
MSSTLLTDADRQWVARSGAAGIGKSLGRRAVGLRDPGVAVPGIVLLLVVLACFLGPAILGLPDPSVGRLQDYLLPIGSPGHPLGTNNLGNDMLSRLLNGGQVSITVGLCATLLGMFIGVPLGAVAGYRGGLIEAAIMRLFDSLAAFPGLILALAIAAYLGPSEWHTVLALGFFGIAGFGRLTHGQTVRVRVRDYVVAARTTGIGTGRIVVQHIIPNISAPIISYALSAAGMAMAAEAGLSFLGLGVLIPQPSWGNIISSGQKFLATAPQLVIMPAVLLFITILCLNLLTDSIRSNEAVR